MIEKAKKYQFTQLLCQDIEQELDCEGLVFDAIGTLFFSYFSVCWSH
jgi:hypothetical protein